MNFSEPMITAAKNKLEAHGFSDRVDLVLADASDLPFPNGYFDAVGIAFGFRNLTYANSGTTAYLAEVHRVLAPKGRFVIVETSHREASCCARHFTCTCDSGSVRLEGWHQDAVGRTSTLQNPLAGFLRQRKWPIG